MIPFLEINNRDIFVYHFDNMNFPAHYHDELEVMVIEKGKINVYLDEQMLCLEQGEMVVVYPHCIHMYETTEEIANQGTLLLLNRTFLVKYQEEMRRYKPEPAVYALRDLHPDVSHSFLTITDSQESYDVRNAYAGIFLCRLIPAIRYADSEVASGDTLHRLLTYLSEHFLEPLSLQSVADNIFMDKYQLSRLFSGKLNTSFPEYINRLRIEHAASLLIHTDESITNIAMNSGFENIRTFHRAFRRIFHVTPGEYRKRYR